jgi:hypothetical protein
MTYYKFTIECQKCKHYYITWDKNFPYGCRAMGFKGKKIPSQTVYKSSGMQCLMFEKKKEKK